jgi:hypothetical protein
MRLIWPDDPADALEVRTLMAPLTPDVPAAAVASFTPPLDVAVPTPVTKDTAPPLALAPVALEAPADTDIPPPLPVFPFPTLRRKEPLFPDVAADVKNRTMPEFPDEDVPVISSNPPLTPELPALLVKTFTLPLDVAEPTPLSIEIEPPLATELNPAKAETEDPSPFAVVPPELRPMVIDPALPLTEAPEAMDSTPDEPLLVVPDLKVRDPLTPVVPALLVATA